MQNPIYALFDDLQISHSQKTQTPIAREAVSQFARRDEVFRIVSKNLQPHSVLEFGTWLGASAAAWALHSSPNTPIVCVDTWLGSWEHLANLNSGPEWGRGNLRIQNGRAEFFGEFLSNLDRLGLKSRVFPISATTQGATKLFEFYGIHFPVIYIDAAHDYIPVLQDLLFAETLLTTNGVMMGDDYETWESVAEAVNDYCDSNSLYLYHGQNSWVVLDFLEPDRKSSLAAELEEIGFKCRRPLKPKNDFQNLYYDSKSKILTLENMYDEVRLELDSLYNSFYFKSYHKLRPLIRITKAIIGKFISKS